VSARPRYAMGVAGWVALLSLTAATALVLLFRVKPALDLVVFGSAARGNETPASAIRGADGVRRGFLPAAVAAEAPASPLLAPPAPPAWTDLGLAPDASQRLGQARRMVQEERWADAVAAYDALVAARPDNVRLAAERARVLQWSGDAARAADAMAAAAARAPQDAALRMEAARFAWWAGREEEADRMAGELLASVETRTAADSLRREVRRTHRPSVATAERWVREGGGAGERLALARALAGEERWADALPHYAAAIDAGATGDSLRMEAASAALAASRPDEAARHLSAWLETRPGDRDARLRLARAQSWAKDYDAAAETYGVLLAEGDDAAVRFERAQALAWGGRTTEAERETSAVLALDPARAEAHALAGDLARWRGDPETAAARYRRALALAPASAETRASLEAAEGEAWQRRLAVVPDGDARVDVAAFGDTEEFRAATVTATRRWRPAWGAVEAEVETGRTTGSLSRARREEAQAFGATARVEAEVRRGLVAGAQVGVRHHEDGGTTPAWGAAVRTTGATRLSAEYRREPAVRRVFTLAALEAGATSDLLRLAGARDAGRLSASAALEAERLRADEGTTDRFGGSVVVSGGVTQRLSLHAGASAVGTRGDVPRTEAGTALWWTPARYVATEAGATYRVPVGERWTVGATLAPGYAWSRERSGGDGRFPDRGFATVSAALDAGVRVGRWRGMAALAWGGAAERGYRAATVRVGASYALESDR
jgi:Flp pilus assembly protein TadD